LGRVLYENNRSKFGVDLANLKGFKEIKMKKLGDTVILAGKMGSGKTGN